MGTRCWKRGYFVRLTHNSGSVLLVTPTMNCYTGNFILVPETGFLEYRFGVNS